MEKSHTYANLDTLSTLARNPKLTSSILKSAEESLIDAIAECALQIASKTVPVDYKAAQLQELLPAIRFLAKKSVSRKRKRNFLIKGGKAILKFILPPVIAYISKHL